MIVRTSFFEKKRTPRRIVASLRMGHNRAATCKELVRRTGAPFSTIRRRLSEMMHHGFIQHDGIRACKVTGNPVYTYRLTDQMDNYSAFLV